jgi:hypothetical protein
MKTLTTQYSQFTPDERLQLTFAAFERKDLLEVERLMRSCPQESRVVLDPRYIVRLDYLQIVVSAQIIRWMEASMAVVLCRWVIACLSAEDVALRATADANWKGRSADWRGIESGFSKFCADANLTSDQLLGMAGGRPTPVEFAGDMLHVDAGANSDCADAVYQILWEVWQGGSEP